MENDGFSLIRNNSLNHRDFSPVRVNNTTQCCLTLLPDRTHHHLRIFSAIALFLFPYALRLTGKGRCVKTSL
ncbi:MAG: hypothetical protein KME52_09100 [Desmonostoc geniculatum HA4340-LM1]|nr:hypothetical protein [Desmonostoc geniculatum HA4340-LM1]